MLSVTPRFPNHAKAKKTVAAPNIKDASLKKTSLCLKRGSLVYSLLFLEQEQLFETAAALAVRQKGKPVWFSGS